MDFYCITHQFVNCTMLWNAVQVSAFKHSATQCGAVQRSPVQWIAVKCSTVQCTAVQCIAVQCSAVQTVSDCQDSCILSRQLHTVKTVAYWQDNCSMSVSQSDYFSYACSHPTTQNLDVFPGNRRHHDHGVVFQAKVQVKNFSINIKYDFFNLSQETGLNTGIQYLQPPC